MRKKDEMEQAIANKAMKVTWFVTIMAMFIIGVTQYFMNNREMNILLVLAMLSVAFHSFLEQYYLSKTNENSKFKKRFAIFLILLILLLGFSWIIS